MVDRKWEQLIRWACAQKMGVMTYGTLGGGILTGKYRELKEYGVDDNRNRFYPYFKEPLFSKVMLLLRTMPVGNTLPDMVITIILCLIAGKLIPEKNQKK